MPNWTLEDLVQEREWRKIAPDWDDAGVDRLLEAFLHFCSKYWWIRHPERGRIHFELFDAQIDCIRMWLTDRYSVALKARQIGFSTLISTFCFWSTFFYSDRAIVMLSKTERDAVKLLEKAKYGSRFLPDWIKNRGPVMQINQTRMGFTNESYLESLPSASDPARGESVYTVVVDELGLLPNSEEAWAAIEPIADVGGRVIMLGTAHGEGNLFHKIWVGSQNRSNRFTGLFFPWWSGDRDQDWYETKVRDLPPWQVAQEYPSDPDEAFLRSGHPVFNVDAIKAMEAVEPARGRLTVDTEGPHFEEVTQGSLRVWEQPDPDMRYCIGADVAEGLEHGDFSAAHVIEAKTRRVVAVYHARVDADLFGSDILFNLGRWYNQALIGVESNNHGLTTNKALHRVGYNPLYKQRPVNRVGSPQASEVLGWRTTSITKPLAIDELNKALRDSELHLFDGETHLELRGYVREGDGKMHGSPHDDRVMALAIACQMLKYVWLREYQPISEPPPGTFGYFEKVMFGRLANKLEPASDRPIIGNNYVRTEELTMAQLAKFTKQREVTRAPNKGRYLKQRLHKLGHSTTTLPTLTSISPTTGTAAGSALTVTLTGTNFVDGITKCQINLPSTSTGGIDQSTTVASATSATVSFPRPAIAGVYGFLVHNGEKYSTTVRTLTIT